MYLVINKCVIAVKVSNFSGHYLRNSSTLDIGVLGYIGIVWPKEHSPEVWHIPPGTLCILNFLRCKVKDPKNERHRKYCEEHRTFVYTKNIYVPFPVAKQTMEVFCCRLLQAMECSLLSNRDLCDKPISRAEKSQGVWVVSLSVTKYNNNLYIYSA